MILDESLFEEVKQKYGRKLSFNKVYDELEDLGYIVRASSNKDNCIVVSKKFEKNLQKAKDYCDNYNLKYEQRFSPIQGRYYLDIILPEGLKEAYKEPSYEIEDTDDKLEAQKIVKKYLPYVRPEVILNVMYGYKIDEIASALNQSRETVRNKIYRNLNQLRDFRRNKVIDKNLEKIKEENKDLDINALLDKMKGHSREDIDNKKKELLNKVLNKEISFKDFYSQLKSFTPNERDSMVAEYTKSLDEAINEDLILDPTEEDKKLLNDLLDKYKGTEYERVLDQLKSKYDFEDTFNGKNEDLIATDQFGIEIYDKGRVKDTDGNIMKFNSIKEAEDYARKNNLGDQFKEWGIFRAWKEERSKEGLKESLSPEQEKEYGLNTLINELIKSEYDAIDEYNSAIVTLEAENQGEYTDVIRSIIEDERHHIGNLQEIMNRITPGTEQEFEHGKEEAIKTLADEKPEEEETTTTTDTEDGVVKTFKLDKVEDMKDKE